MPTLYNMQAELKDLLNVSSQEMASLVGSITYSVCTCSLYVIYFL